MKNEHNDHNNHCPGAAPYVWRAENIDATRRLAEYLAQALKDHTETERQQSRAEIFLSFFSYPLRWVAVKRHSAALFCKNWAGRGLCLVPVLASGIPTRSRI